MNFEFVTAPRIVFGAGDLERIAELAAALGKRAWLVSGGDAMEWAGVLTRVTKLLAPRGITVTRLTVSKEPDTKLVDAAVRAAREASCDMVIGLGGGSTLDTAKAVACIAANGGECLDYLEVVGRGKPITSPSLPLIAVPTTGGTGSEVTHNAVIADAASGTKASIRHPYLLPRVALLDPTLTHSVPREVTASTGLDALTQLIEPYVSRRAHPMIDVLALEGIRRAAVALPRAYADGKDAAARGQMMLAAMWSGMALSHCGLGAAHGFAGPLGGSFPIPHGMACAALLPHATETNLRVAATDPNGPETTRRYADVARALGASAGSSDRDTALAGLAIVERLCRELSVPALARFGVTRKAVPDLVARAKRTSSMKANPVDLSDEDLAGMLERAIG